MTQPINTQLKYSPLLPSAEEAVSRAQSLLLSQQSPEGYWWYTLEANESIGAGFIQLMHFIGEVDSEIEKGIVGRILDEQRADGSWAIFYEGPGDLSVSIECYLALRLAGFSPEEEPMLRARQFILSQGGFTQMRVFSRIHMALFGIIPWSVCPAMPIWFARLPAKSGISIYEFSSWARACIVPLLITYEKKPVRPVSFNLDELYVEPEGERVFDFPKSEKKLSLQNFFIYLDVILKKLEKIPLHPGKKWSLRFAERWVREHIERTEDIYPAMAYSVIGLTAMGYPKEDPTIKKAMNGLERFQQSYHKAALPALPGEEEGDESTLRIHQQCCISPNWDTPWTAVALLESGIPADDPALLKAARYMIQKEIRNFRGDWAHKNPHGPTGGWAFEFENDFFPDVDDTVEALFFLKEVGLPEEETKGPIQRGLNWVLSMQSQNGGWGAFDKNNMSQWVNQIPFSDHGACLDPPTSDLTGRVIELMTHFKFSPHDPIIVQAKKFLAKHQEKDGSWRGRWGVNYIYGTWCVLQGLMAIGEDPHGFMIRRSIDWLKKIQNPDGGWGESCLSDTYHHYIPLETSTPSQTAWALMGLIAAGEAKSEAVERGIHWLKTRQLADGGWDERHSTGTGFPGHFFIRYHGYRYYFPLLALGKYQKAIQ